MKIKLLLIFTFCIASLCASGQVPPGAVGEYYFSGNLDNSAGSQDFTTSASSLTYFSDRFGNALSSIYIDSNIFNGYTYTGTNNNVSISFWVNISVNDPATQRLVQLIDNSGKGFKITYQPNGPLTQVDFESVNDAKSAGTVSVPKGQWVHLALTIEQTSTGFSNNFYINGVLDANVSSAISSNRVSQFLTSNATFKLSPFTGQAFSGTMDDVVLYERALSQAEVTSLFNATDPRACIVNIPDANFKAALVADSGINTNGDGEIQCAEASNFNGQINISNANFNDLTGIEAFTSITGLIADRNNFTSINLQNNISLTTLDLRGSNLTTLDLSANTLLESLNVTNNNLSALDLSNQSNLEILFASKNVLNNIDLSSNTNLLNLNLDENNLSSLNLSANTQLTGLLANQNTLSSVDLSTLTALTFLSLNNNNLTTIDLSSNDALTYIDLANNQLSILDVANGNNSAITTFNSTSNSALSCIQIDTGFTPPSGWQKDATASYSNNCSNTTDTTNPVAVCQDVTLQLDSNGTATLTAAQVDNGSSDDVGVASTTVDITSFDCSNVGTNTVTLTVMDAAGNSDTCTATVIIEDNEAPTVTCPSDVAVAVNQGAQYSIPNYTAVSNDNCSTTLSQNPAAGTMVGVGVHTVTFTATDPSGNTSNCSFDITVTENADTTNPVAVCQDVTLQLDSNGTATLTATQVDNGSSDDVGVASTTIDITTFDCSNVGATMVTLTVTDAAGNSDTCTATVTVEDNEAPTVTCPSDVAVAVNQGAQYSIPNYTAVSNDNCSTTLSQSPAAGTMVGVGVHTVTFTATDPSGNTSNCSFDITVTENADTTNPVAVCQDVTLQLDSNGTATLTAAQVDNGSSDDVGVASTTIDITSFDCSNVGATMVTLTVTDAAGNSDTCTATVIIEDNEAPTVTCPSDVAVVVNQGAQYSIPNYTAVSNDNCSTTLSQSPAAGTMVGVGVHTVTFTATDPSGNTSNCSFDITVTENADTTNPVAVCQDVTLQLDSNGTATLTAAQVDNGSSDDVGVASTTIDITSFDCSNIGITMVTLTVTDAAGNSDTCTATITVEDNEAPTITCPSDETVSVDQGDQYTIPNYTLSFQDNCSATVSQSPAAGTTIGAGVQTITFTATDPSGNSVDCSFNLTVDETLSIKDQSAIKVSVYPNPVTDILMIDTATPVEKVNVYALSGQKVFSTTSSQVEMSTLSTGIYFVHITTGQGSSYKRVIKK
ncbi:HYR domain-containing protein [Dokdonia sp. Hel_I_53]|uniref:HYR domain-containing protein n=1 Tax=Dokdonia sp. Hel_I_53 TaxID=1566287 RepID=UPI00119B1BCE|nr:HYR domain-containing protein [Dokdonia sp. Hel_I_53]TVZ52463.1 putative secreted protein (Por secretion system target) [Dokdonia sp. Hel_I_53]